MPAGTPFTIRLWRSGDWEAVSKQGSEYSLVDRKMRCAPAVCTVLDDLKAKQQPMSFLELIHPSSPDLPLELTSVR